MTTPGTGGGTVTADPAAGTTTTTQPDPNAGPPSNANLASAALGSVLVKEFKVYDSSLDEVALELGVYFLFLVFCMLVLLDQVRGKPGKLKNWLLFRKLVVF